MATQRPTKVWTWFHTLLAASALIVAHAPSARSQPELAQEGIYYATLGNNASIPGALIAIDVTTGAGSILGPTGIVGGNGDDGVPALAIRSTGEIIAMEIGPSSRVYQIDALTGADTLLSTTSLNSPPAIAFDGSDLLWAVDVGGTLYTLDYLTGIATTIGATGVFIKGMAFDPTTGVLWGTDASGGVYTLDKQTGAATLVGNTGLPPTSDICFDAAGTMYGSSGGGFVTNNLITIDRVTGAGQVVGSIGYVSVSGMATRHQPFVAVAVLSYRALWATDHVEVRWRLLDPTGSISFDVARSEMDAPFRRVDGPRIGVLHGEFVMADEDVTPGRDYRYHVAVLEEGVETASFETRVAVPGVRTSLGQNYPNPFNPRTSVAFSTGAPGHVTLIVYNASGEALRTLVDGDRPAGSFTESWDGRDEKGTAVASGVYFFRLRAGKETLTRKAVLIK